MMLSLILSTKVFGSTAVSGIVKFNSQSAYLQFDTIIDRMNQRSPGQYLPAVYKITSSKPAHNQRHSKDL